MKFHLRRAKIIVYSLLFLLLFVHLGAAAQIDVTKPISGKQLSGMSLTDLWLLRNEIFARHGRPFKTYELHAYFVRKGFEPDRNYSDSRLSRIELNNVQLIQEREKELLKKNFVTGEKGGKVLNPGNIINRFQYWNFSADQQKLLAENGFFINPDKKYDQLFHVYENNDYLGIPSFITTDSILQVYSILFDLTLRHIEEEILADKLQDLTNAMVEQASELHAKAQGNLVKEAARNTVAYFEVPSILLTNEEDALDADTSRLVRKELALIEQHHGPAPPPILAMNNPRYSSRALWVDYSQFQPRGHYTRSETLKNYFKASLWLGLYPLHASEGFDVELVQALLVTKLLYSGKSEGTPLIDLWTDIYEPTAFYVGLSDDLAPEDLKRVMDEVYGSNAGVEALNSPEKLKIVRRKLADIFKNKTRIKTVFNDMPQGPHFMLMGQRYIPDSEIMQRLIRTTGKMRPFPKGLDVMAVLESRLAGDMMLTRYKADWAEGFPGYPQELEKLKKEFSALTQADWRKNLYYSWLWALKALIASGTKENNAPFFMKGRGWETKSLITSLASWAELRHHTILYAKQSFGGAECGGGGEEKWKWLPDPPMGYVEPKLEFYHRMQDIITLSTDGLRKRGMLDSTLQSLFSRFSEIVSFLENISKKELSGEARTVQEYEQIRRFGSLLDNLTLDIFRSQTGVHVSSWHEMNGPDMRVPVIADVHTASINGNTNVLEEGVGPAREIYVVVEIDGKLKLTRGAVFSYYEFIWPASDRLTDEKWQSMLDKKAQPAAPDWTKDVETKDPPPGFMPVYVPSPEEKEASEAGKRGWQAIYYDTGC